MVPLPKWKLLCSSCLKWLYEKSDCLRSVERLLLLQFYRRTYSCHHQHCRHIFLKPAGTSTAALYVQLFPDWEVQCRLRIVAPRRCDSWGRPGIVSCCVAGTGWTGPRRASFCTDHCQIFIGELVQASLVRWRQLFRSPLNSRGLWNTLPQNVSSAPSLTVLQETPEDLSLQSVLYPLMHAGLSAVTSSFRSPRKGQPRSWPRVAWVWPNQS